MPWEVSGRWEVKEEGEEFISVLPGDDDTVRTWEAEEETECEDAFSSVGCK